MRKHLFSLFYILAVSLTLGTACRRVTPLPPPVPIPGPVDPIVPDPVTPGPAPEPVVVQDGPQDQVNAFNALRTILGRFRAGEKVPVGDLQKAELSGGFRPYKTLTRDAAGNPGVTRYVYSVWFPLGTKGESRDAEVVTSGGVITGMEVGV